MEEVVVGDAADDDAPAWGCSAGSAGLPIAGHLASVYQRQTCVNCSKQTLNGVDGEVLRRGWMWCIRLSSAFEYQGRTTLGGSQEEEWQQQEQQPRE